MSEPPHKRARRSENNLDRIRDSRSFKDARDRGSRDDRGGRGRDADSYMERDRRYRSRSRERERDRHRDRDRYEGRDRGGSRNDTRDRDRGRDGARGSRRDEGREKDYRDSRGGDRERDRDRKRPREDSSDRRVARSRSPWRDVPAVTDPRRSPLLNNVAHHDGSRGQKSGTETPPVAFKVPHTESTGAQIRGHQNGPVVPETSDQVTGIHGGAAGQGYGDIDVDLPEGHHMVSMDKKSKSSKNKPKEPDVDEDDDIVIEEDDSMAAMQAMLGIGGFGTTKQKKISGNDAYAVRKEKKTMYRQYMNRQGGFNRPLSPSRE